MPESRLRFLADASMLLAGSLEIRPTLRQLAVMIVPQIADWCTIAVRDDDGVIRRIAGMHRDPARAQAMYRYMMDVDPMAHRASAMTEAVAMSRSLFRPHIEPQELEQIAQSPDHLALLRELGLTSAIVVPLIARGASIGALSLAMCTRERELGELDHQLARELGVLVGLAVDNAGRLAAERAARERAERAEADAARANRAKDDFLAMLGHELRNPLAPIVTALDLMRARDDAPAREVTVIERQTRHLVRLVDDLLDVSKIARGGVVLHRQPVEAADVVHQAIEMTGALFEQRGQQLTVDVPAGLVLDADATRVAQVIANLLSNSSKYTSAGGRIEVRAWRTGARIAIAVRDNGMGIATDILPHVFEMFVQERQALDRSRGGLGLGLTIVKSLVEAHGGTVAAHSAGTGEGSEFTIELPASAHAVAAAPPAEPAATSRPGARVLVVDDNEDAAALMADTLERAGYVTRVAHDAGEALAAVRDFTPAAAILDIGLPVVDGYELARRLRALPGFDRVCLIALTGYSQASDRDKALAAGFDRHLVKPVTAGKIRAILDAAVAASSGIPAAT